ncbi:hypothetical protein HDK77DRAFT_487884 [Phyllosticta capitalensis]
MDTSFYKDHHSSRGINSSTPARLSTKNQTFKGNNVSNSLLQWPNHLENSSGKGFGMLIRIWRAAAGVLFRWRSKKTVTTKAMALTLSLQSDGRFGQQGTRIASTGRALGGPNVYKHAHSGSCNTLLEGAKLSTSTLVGLSTAKVAALKAGTTAPMFSFKPSDANTTVVSCEVSPADLDDNVDLFSRRDGIEISCETFIDPEENTAMNENTALPISEDDVPEGGAGFEKASGFDVGSGFDNSGFNNGRFDSGGSENAEFEDVDFGIG